MNLQARLTYANVMSTLAVFLALGGGLAWALDRNSVKSKHIKNGQVKVRDLARPERVQSAGLRVLTDGESCAVNENAWVNFGPGPVGYFRDLDGTVHLVGIPFKCNAATDGKIFTLPPGYRPEYSEVHLGSDDGSTGVGRVNVSSDGAVFSQSNGISLSSVSFRCRPSGRSGCP